MRNSMNNLNATLCSVLIIEDSPEDSSTYKRFLSGPGDFRYTTMEAARAGDGMKLWRTHRPDCIDAHHRPRGAPGRPSAAGGRRRGTTPDRAAAVDAATDDRDPQLPD